MLEPNLVDPAKSGRCVQTFAERTVPDEGRGASEANTSRDFGYVECAFRLDVLLICALLNLFAGTRASVSQDADADSQLRTRINEIVTPYLAAGDFQGVVAVQREGAASVIIPYGLASVELNVPHKASSVFLIGSVSKQFTAAAVLLLEEDGLLRTGDLIRDYLPDFKSDEDITIEQLLTHTSGVADIFSLKRFRETAAQGGSFDQIIEDLEKMKLTQKPGSAFRYSNGGYAVLAALVERVSGNDFGDFLKRRIFDPLGMQSTAHDGPGPAANDRVPGYDPWGQDRLTPAMPMSPVYTTGSGSLWSSAADLLTWTSALHGGRVLSDSSYRKLTHDCGYSYGYGVSVFRRFDRDVIGHDGRGAGYASDVAWYLADSLSVVIMSNVQSVARDEIRRLVAAAGLDLPYSVPPPRVFLHQPPTVLGELVGAYEFGPGFRVTISESDGRLLARANEGIESELIALDKTAWFSRMLYATVRFGRDEEGLVDRLIWGLGENAPVGLPIREDG